MPPNPQPDEQLRYARAARLTSKLGFVALVAGFVAYVFGWLAGARDGREQLPQLWSLPLAEYLARTDTPTGWGWLAHLHKGEFAGLVGIAVLAGCSVVCLAAVIPGVRAPRRPRLRRRSACSRSLVLLLAASGRPDAGH